MVTDARDEPGSTKQAGARPGGPAPDTLASQDAGLRLPATPADGQPSGPRGSLLQRSPVARHLLILVCYLVAGIAATWPRGAYLVQGRLQATRDAGVYVWDFWWMAHQVLHLSNPWYTRAIAAPVGAQLGYHALMPLDGVVMLPVTLLFGPSASYNLLSILMPGLMGYAMYRAARLWLPGQLAPLAAGAFYGLSAEMAWHAWYQLNLAAGVLFLPVALEAAIRLRRSPRWPQALFLGAAIGCSLLSDQESAVLVVILAAVVLLPWLLGARGWDGLVPAASPADTGPVDGSPDDGGPDPGGTGQGGPPGRALAPQPLRTRLAAIGMTVVAALVVGSPQIAAMEAQTRSGGAYIPPQLVNFYYARSAAYLPSMFLASPRLASLSSALRPITSPGATGDGVPTFGLIVTVLAVLGLATFWRRRTAWLFAVIWLGSAALALGTTLRIGNHVYLPLGQEWQGVKVSDIMPFTWFVRLPGMAGFRESARILMMGFPAAAMLAGAGVYWLQKHSRVLFVVLLAAAALELGWQGSSATALMPTTLPGWTARSPLTTRTRSWWTSRSASGAGCRCPARAPASTRMSRCWRPPMGIPGRSPTCRGSPRRRCGRSPRTRSTVTCCPCSGSRRGSWPRSGATQGTARWDGRPPPRSSPPGRTPSGWAWAGCWSGRKPPASVTTWPAPGSASPTGPTASRFTGLPGRPPSRRGLRVAAARADADRYPRAALSPELAML